MRKISTKIILFCLCIALSACARTPNVIDAEKLNISVQKDLSLLAVDAPLENIDLHTAIAIGIKNNRDLRISVMESALAQRQSDLQRFDMLPDIALNAGYSEFNELQPSTSVSVENDVGDAPALDGTQSYTISRDKGLETRNIEFTWNALDFGLSYIRAGQQADRYLIAKELERKATQNITRDIIRAYWKAQASENLLKKLNPLLERVETALADSKYIEELLISAPMDSLLYQKELLDVQRTLQTQQRALINSKNELAILMGLLPGQKFSLSSDDTYLTNINMRIETMEEMALVSRPELMESRYQKRITSKDTKAAILGLIPSIKFNATYGYSDNEYLLNQDTTEYGASIGANLFNVFSLGAVRKSSEASKDLIAERHLAIAMTVLSQVHLSNMNYALAIEEYDTAQRYLDVAQRISKQVQNAQKVSRFGELEVIREEASLLVAELRRDLAFSEMQHSIGQIYASIGKDILPDNHQNLSIEDVSKNIETNLSEWGEVYQAAVNLPISEQDPMLLIINDPINTQQTSNKFQISENTFNISGPGKLRFQATQEDGTPLPRWLAFLTSDLSFVGNPPTDVSGIKLKVSVANALVSVEDKFTLRFMDEGEFLAQEGEGARQKLIQLGLDKKEANKITTDDEISEIPEIIDEPSIDLDEYTVSNEMVINDADSLNDLLDSVDNTLQKAQNILDDAAVENEEAITDIDIIENQVSEPLITNDEASVDNSEETLDLVSVLPKKKILNTVDENSLVEEATAARDLLTELNNTAELENKLVEEASQALEDLTQLIEEPTEVVSNAFSAQASDIEETELTIDTSDAEFVYIKIGSYTRGNSAFSFMNYIYDVMGFDSRFLKYDINVDKFDKNDYSVIVGPVPMGEAKSMLEALDTQLSSQNSSIIEAELVCNEEIILMCSI
jgi:outer membrane protein TolC